jgi:hypothetical protein
MLRGVASPHCPAAAARRARHVASGAGGARQRSAAAARALRRGARCSLPPVAPPAAPLLDAGSPGYEYPLAIRFDDAAGEARAPLLRAPQLAAPPASPAARLRAAAEWAALAALAARAYGGNARRLAAALAARLAGAPPPPAPGAALEGTRLRLSLDVGREPGTWMPPQWGLSGRRLCFDVAVELRAGGECVPLAVGAFAGARFGAGRWSVGDAADADELRLELPLLEPLQRGDVALTERLFLRTRAWGAVVQRRGTLLLRQSRWLVRQEFRLVGTFAAETLPPQDDGQPAAAQPQLSPMRVRQRFTE